MRQFWSFLCTIFYGVLQFETVNQSRSFLKKIGNLFDWDRDNFQIWEQIQQSHVKSSLMNFAYNLSLIQFTILSLLSSAASSIKDAMRYTQ